MRPDQDGSSSALGTIGLDVPGGMGRIYMLTHLQAKLNQILRIEEELGDKAVYVGNNFRSAVNL